MTAADSSALNTWSTAYSWAVALVILGVTLEGPEIVLRVANWIRSWRKDGRAIEPWYDAPHAPSKSPEWMHVMEGLGWIILVIGLILEQWAHVRINDIKDREISRLVTELTETEKELTSAKKKVIWLEAEMFGRHILDETNSIKHLSIFTNINFTLSWQSPSQDNEAEFLTDDLIPLLNKAKWHHLPQSSNFGSTNILYGPVWIRIFVSRDRTNDLGNLINAAFAIQGELLGSGTSSHIWGPIVKTDETNHISIEVQAKDRPVYELRQLKRTQDQFNNRQIDPPVFLP